MILGVLIENEEFLPKYQCLLIDYLSALDDVEVHILRPNRVGISSSRRWKLNKLFWGGFKKIDSIFSWLTWRDADVGQPRKLNHNCTEHVVNLSRCTPILDDVDTSDDLDLPDFDLCVRLGFKILGPRLLSKLSCDVLSYHGGSLTNYRGAPAGFWEWISGERVIKSTLQLLTPELDAGVAIREARTRVVQHSWLQTRNELLKAQIDLIIFEVLRFSRGSSLEKKPATYPKLPLNFNPSIKYTFIGCVKTAINSFWWIAKKMFKRKVWCINITNYRSKPHFGKNSFNLIGTKTEFWADPFIIKEEHNNLVFLCEKYSEGYGKIYRFEIQQLDNSIECVSAKCLLSHPKVHFSYPNLFCEEGRIYLCPEIQNSDKIHVYELNTDATQVINNFSLELDVHFEAFADPNIIKFEDKYYLFITLDFCGSGNLFGNCFVFVAESLRGKFQLLTNDAVFCCTSGRNAGQIYSNDFEVKLMSQAKIFDYGDGLSTKTYCFEKHSFVTSEDVFVPSKSLKNVSNIHHYVIGNHWSLIDYQIKVNRF